MGRSAGILRRIADPPRRLIAVADAEEDAGKDAGAPTKSRIAAVAKKLSIPSLPYRPRQ
jgi:hypothetical protein